jgi:hypothetical protein
MVAHDAIHANVQLEYLLQRRQPQPFAPKRVSLAAIGGKRAGGQRLYHLN